MTRVFRSNHLDPEARGRELGTMFARQIQANVAMYGVLFDRVTTRPFDLRLLGAEALERVAKFAPPLHAEMLGIAHGSHIQPELIGAINARTEILAHLRAPLRGECTTVVRIDPHSPRAVAVQTWDWYAEFADQWFVWEIAHADGSTTKTMTEFGIVGKAGLNTRGLGIHFNILHHDRDGLGEMGVPVHAVSRWLLDSATDLAAAIQLLNQTRVSASSALTLIASADETSAAVTAELHPGGPGIVFPEADGLLLHTNHFLSAPANQHDSEPRAFPDTLLRLDLLQRRLRNRSDLDTASVIAALNSHLTQMGALCCHPDARLHSVGQYATLTTLVLDVARGSLEALPGGPCRHVRPKPSN